MESSFEERSEQIRDLHRMLDIYAEQNKETISKGETVVVDIAKHEKLTFNIVKNDQEITVTKDVYDVLVEKNGELYHEFYDDQGVSLCEPISDKEFQEGKKLEELGLGTFDENSLIYNVYKDDDVQSLTELEQEQNNDIKQALRMDECTAEELKLLEINTDQTVKNKELDKAQDEIAKLAALGMVVDTNELATSDQTIKEFLNIDANKLLLVQINDEWKALKINEDGTLSIENNLQIIDNNQPFTTVREDGKTESRIPEIEFRRKDNPDYSLAIDSNNEENRTQAYLVAGNSRTGAELEATSTRSPYANAKNNELLKEAQEKPNDKVVDEERNPHEPELGPRSLDSNDNY